jgi:hypothetical protein
MKKKVTQSKALELIDESISQFKQILAKATYENRHDETYLRVYHGAEALLTELFSKEEAMEFRRNVTSIMVSVGKKIDYVKELKDYKDHLGRCIAQLEVYKGRIQNFWVTDEPKETVKPAEAQVVKEDKKAVKKRRLTLGNAVSAIIVVAILIILYSPTIVSLVSPSLQPQKIELSFSPYTPGYSYTRDNLAAYSTARTGVLGYTCNIYLSLEKAGVEIGQAIKIHVQIDNTGNPLTKPYFYVFLVNNTGKVEWVFPEGVGLLVSYKLPKWTVKNANGIDYWYASADTNLMIPRGTLIAGQGDCWNSSDHKSNCEIWFQRQIAHDSSQIGKWEVWIFVFDETYQTSGGAVVPSENAIAYTTQFFDVTPKARPETPSNPAALWLWSSRAASFGFVILSAYGLFTRLSPWIDFHSSQTVSWWKRNWWIILFSALLLVLYMILFLLGA